MSFLNKYIDWHIANARIVAVWTATRIPGGAPARGDHKERVAYRQLFHVLRDRNFLIYMVALGVLIIGTVPMGSFLPLYMEQQVGLSESQVVFLQIGVLVGGLATTYLFGWAANGYGSILYQMRQSPACKIVPKNPWDENW